MKKLALPSGDTINLADDQDGQEAMQAVMNYAQEEVSRLADTEAGGDSSDGVYGFADDVRSAQLSGEAETPNSETADPDGGAYGFAE